MGCYRGWPLTDSAELTLQQKVRRGQAYLVEVLKAHVDQDSN